MAKAVGVRISDAALDRQIARARERGRRIRATYPFAVRASYDVERQRIAIELSNGFSFAFPPSMFADLAKGTSEQLSHLMIDPSGYGVHWPELDADYDIGGIVQIALGAKKWVSITEMGRLGGKSTSKAKRAAAAANGLKGGRPPKRASAKARKATKVAKR
jgi:hypothetical protein